MNTRENIMDKISDYTKELGKELQEDSSMSTIDKLPQIELLININKFLNDYDENIKVLNKYWIEKNRRLKFERSKEEYEEPNK